MSSNFRYIVLDLTVARVDEQVNIDAKSFVVLVADSGATLRLGAPSNPSIPAVRGFRVCDADLTGQIFITNAASAVAGDELVIAVIPEGADICMEGGVDVVGNLAGTGTSPAGAPTASSASSETLLATLNTTAGNPTALVDVSSVERYIRIEVEAFGLVFPLDVLFTMYLETGTGDPVGALAFNATDALGVIGGRYDLGYLEVPVGTLKLRLNLGTFTNTNPAVAFTWGLDKVVRIFGVAAGVTPHLGGTNFLVGSSFFGSKITLLKAVGSKANIQMIIPNPWTMERAFLFATNISGVPLIGDEQVDVYLVANKNPGVDRIGPLFTNTVTNAAASTSEAFMVHDISNVMAGREIEIEFTRVTGGAAFDLDIGVLLAASHR